MHNQETENLNPVVKAIKRVRESVVSITVTKELPNEALESLVPAGPAGLPSPSLPKQPEDRLPHEHERTEVGGGSGFIVTSDGLILTNKHVLRDPTATYSVVLSDEKVVPAKILSRDFTNDIAVLKISPGPSADGLPVAPLGDSSSLELGQTLIAIGNALGAFANTVSVGVVSGLTRSLSAQDGIGGGVAHLRGLIQTDAAINPGNSGGPLVNIRGEAVGINVATVMGAENIGFAIPINVAKKDLSDIERYGRIRKPFLGVRYIIIDKKLKRQFDLPVDHGVYVLRQDQSDDPAVVPESPAAKAGLIEKDIILSFNNIRLDKKKTLQDALENFRVGEKAKVIFLRDGRKHETIVYLEERLA